MLDGHLGYQYGTTHPACGILTCCEDQNQFTLFVGRERVELLMSLTIRETHEKHSGFELLLAKTLSSIAMEKRLEM